MSASMNACTRTPTEDASKTTAKRHPCRSTCAQLLATLIQGWLFLDLGLEAAVPTLIIGALHRNPSATESLRMNNDQASWYGSLQSFCFPIASLSSAFLQELIGRRGCMMAVNVPSFAAWMTLYLAESVPALYVASAIMGLSSGLSEASLHSYIGEIGEPRLRGTLSSLSASGFCAGSLGGFILGYYFDWRTVVLISSACPVIAFICMTQIPESPTWLIVRNRMDEAKKSLCWLRGWVSPNEIEEEFQTLVQYVKNSSAETRRGLRQEISKASTEENSSILKEFILIIKVLASKKVFRPLRMVFITFVISSVACVGGIRPFLIGELKDLGTTIDPKLVLIMFQVIFFVGSMFNVTFVHRFGKRRLAIYSHSFAAIMITGMGAYCSYSSFYEDNSNSQLPWIPVALFAILNLVEGVGITLLPWQLTCEVFPPVGRGLAAGISAAWSKLVFSALIKSFLYLEVWLNLSGVMYLYAGLTVFGILYHYFYLPETEGKSLEQIESYYTNHHTRKEKIKMGDRCQQR